MSEKLVRIRDLPEPALKTLHERVALAFVLNNNGFVYPGIMNLAQIATIHAANTDGFARFDDNGGAFVFNGDDPKAIAVFERQELGELVAEEAEPAKRKGGRL